MLFIFDLARRKGCKEAISSNDRLHIHQKAKATRHLREMGAYVAATTTTSKVGFRQFSEERPCTVTITVHGPTKRKFDAPNFWPTVKALQDGMTDAKLWTDDNGSVIKATTFKHGEGKSGHDGYKFKIEIKPYKEKKA